MKYNVGDEVLLKAKIVSIDNNSTSGVSIRVELPEEFYFWIAQDEIVGVAEAEMPNTEPKEDNWEKIRDGMFEAYTDGLNDAWELAKKIWSGKDNENVEIFGTKFVYEIYQLTPQEALAKLNDYEDSKIEVGDVVQYGNRKIIVTKISKDKEVVYGFDGQGDDFCYNVEGIKKTGKHIDISSILEQIGE